MSDSKTRIALVTGGSRGLGRRIALKLAEQGTDVILSFQRNEAQAREVVQRIEALGRRAVALQLDVAESSGFDDFAQRVRRALASTWQRERFDRSRSKRQGRSPALRRVQDRPDRSQEKRQGRSPALRRLQDRRDRSQEKRQGGALMG